MSDFMNSFNLFDIGEATYVHCGRSMETNIFYYLILEQDGICFDAKEGGYGIEAYKIRGLFCSYH